MKKVHVVALMAATAIVTTVASSKAALQVITCPAMTGCTHEQEQQKADAEAQNAAIINAIRNNQPETSPAAQPTANTPAVNTNSVSSIPTQITVVEKLTLDQRVAQLEQQVAQLQKEVVILEAKQ